MRVSETDLILNADGSLYHLNLLPGDLADTIILVGDPERVSEVSKYFDSIELRKGKREFITHTGYIGNKRLSVVSTGIGTDNIDIVLNELDALVNINLVTRISNKQLKSLNFVRIGTSGTVQADIEIDTLLVSEAAFGLDALMHYYQHELSTENQQLHEAFTKSLPPSAGFRPYLTEGNSYLVERLGNHLPKGITITTPGFYAPQGRQVRAQATAPDLLQTIQSFNHNGRRITNLEMETAGIYGMAAVLGHKAVSFNVLLANRITQQFSKQPAQIMDKCIREVLERITLMNDE